MAASLFSPSNANKSKDHINNITKPIHNILISGGNNDGSDTGDEYDGSNGHLLFPTQKTFT